MVIGILLISAVAKLRIYLESIGRLDGITSVYLDIKDEKMLRARLSKRGENPDDIEQRIRECRSWALERDASGVPFIILDGHANSDDLALEVEEHTKS
jgi:ribose 1,5-bisphosphokinase PhnN